MNVTAYVRGYLAARRLDGPPIIIGGCERSGTTLLTAILSAHPHVHAASRETWAFCHGRRGGFADGRPIRPSRLYRCLGGEQVKDTARRWAEKSPANIFYFDEIREHFDGRVRLIHIIRDGRDVVLSEHPKKPGEPWVPAHRWKRAAAAGLAYLDDPDVLTLRYRDLVLDFAREARQVCNFISEPFAPELMDWHSHATLRESVNLNGGSVPKLHAGSLRKFEQPGCRHVERAEALASDPEGARLLAAYGFGTGEPCHPIPAAASARPATGGA